MNKCLILLLVFCSSFTSAQNAPTTVGNGDMSQASLSVSADSESVIKRTFVKGFQKKYTDKAFVYQFKTPEKNAWDRFKEWLAHIFKNIFRFTNNQTSLNFVEILLKTIAILIVVFVIYLLVKALMNKEGQWIFGKASDKKLIHYTEIERKLQLKDFEDLIRNTLTNGEKRLTIRYYYLWLLKKMAHQQWIEWDIEKTNSDYLYELQTQSRKDDFAYLSYLYNYIWYGEFDLDQTTFEKAKAAFEKAIKSMGNV